MVRWGYPARDFSESRPAPFRKLLFAGVPCPLTHDGADPSRVKQGKFIAYLEQGPFPAKSIFYLAFCNIPQEAGIFMVRG